MNVDAIKAQLNDAIDELGFSGTYTPTQEELDALTDRVALELGTVNPTKEYPPVKL